MALIACRDVSFAYDGGIVASGLDFEVNSGDYLCIVGENGSGKSTLVKGLTRLKAPYKGRIVISEELKPGEIGYLPQQTDVQKDFPASAYEVVLSGRMGGCGIRPFYSRTDKKIANQYIKLLDIQNLKYRCYRELSGGQQQRVLLARALCATQKLLLLDEPVSGLDPLAAQEMYTQIERINREMSITVIMVSHDIQSAVRYASHILHLENTQAFFGKTDEYKKSAAGKQFLGCACE